MKFYGELLILILLLITNGRVLFVKKAKRDALVVLAPMSVLLVVLQICAWGLDLFSAISFVISILVLLSNFHALFRYSESLYIDHYSPLMKFWAVITCFLSLVTIVGAVYFSPVEYDSNRLGISEVEHRYKGSFRSGFEEAGTFQFCDVVATEFSLEKSEDNSEEKLEENLEQTRDVVLFIPDKRGDTQYYKPYLQFLSKCNLDVWSFDFYADDCKWLHSLGDSKIVRRSFMVIQSLMDNTKFMSQREYYTYNISLELGAITKLLNARYGDDVRFYLVTDVMGRTACDDYKKNNPDKVTGIYYLDENEDYKTAGYGFIEMTDPLLANYMGFEKDTDGFFTRYVANKTAEKIKTDWNLQK